MISLINIMLRLSLTGGVTCLVCQAASALLRGRQPKAWLYCLWLMVAVSFLVPVPLKLALPVPEIHFPAPQVTAAPLTTGHSAGLYNDDAPFDPPSSNLLPRDETAAPAPSTEAPGSHIDAYRILSIGWAAGAAGLLLWHAAGYCLAAARLKKERVLLTSGRLPVYESARVTTPLLVGLLRPVIYLPKDYINRELAVRHELCHWRRGDLWSKWLVQLAACIHWFNPLVYLVKSKLHRLSELSCDEAVIRHMDEAGRRAYGQMLLDTLRVSSDLGGPMIAVLGYKKQWLRERLLGIMNKRLVTKKSVVAMAVLVCCVFSTAILSGGYLSGCAADTPADRQTAAAPSDEGAVAAGDIAPIATASGSPTSTELPEKIYVVDENGETIEVNVNEACFIHGDSIKTQLDDQAISALVGLTVKFPETLHDYTLKEKFIGATSGVKVSYTDLDKLDFTNAVTDDAAFEALSAYNPTRYCSAMYQSGKGSISVSIHKDDPDNEDLASFYNKLNAVDVNIGPIQGLWRTLKFPVYPDILDNTKPPIRIVTCYSLQWTSNGILYFIFSPDQLTLTQEVAIELAQAYMEAQEKTG